MTAHSSRDLTTQVIDVLEAAGLTVGRAQAPTSIPANSGYVVVYPLTGGVFDGDIYDPYEEAEASYQLTAVGRMAEQCEAVADDSRAAMLAGSFTLSGRKVIQVEPVFIGGLQRDDDVQPPLWYSPDRYTIWTGES